MGQILIKNATLVNDTIATDHAPHTWDEKQGSYFNAPSGIPLVQHALQMTLELYYKGIFTLETIVQKTSHAPAVRYQVKDRGFLREGYYADLTLIDLSKEFTVDKSNLLYQCGWSPLEGYTFKSTIDTTIVNGTIKYQNGQIIDKSAAKRLEFDR